MYAAKSISGGLGLGLIGFYIGLGFVALRYFNAAGAAADDPQQDSGFSRVFRHVESRLHLIPPMRRRLLPAPLGLDQPYWIEDPEFDLDFHVRHHGVPPPGDDRQLSEVVARIVGRPMDRSEKSDPSPALNPNGRASRSGR